MRWKALAVIAHPCRRREPQLSRSLTATPLIVPQVLTGATGSLGAHILARLLASSAVEKIICLSRAKSHEDSRTRLKDSLSQRKLSIPADFDSKVISYAADVNDDLLGLTQDEYDGTKASVTHVIHVRALCFRFPSVVLTPFA